MAAPLARWLVILGLVGVLPAPSWAQQKTFVLRGASLTLQEATAQVNVFFSSMRYNRASNVWNFEVTLTNHSTGLLSGPVVLSIESFSGTSGPIAPDGFDATAKPFYDLSSSIADGSLLPGQRSLPRTLTLGFSGTAPQVVTRVFVRPAILPAALATARTLDEAGQPLPDAQVLETGPVAVVTNRTDPVFGVVTLGQAPGLHTWQLSAAGRMPVWRQMILTTNGVAVLPSPRLTLRATNAFPLTPIAGGRITNNDSSIQVSFAPGSVVQATTATLTTLSGQTLPGFLPLGWSPLRAFWLELGREPTLPGTGSLTLLDAVSRNETAALVRWNPATTRWEVAQLVVGNGSNQLTIGLPGSGAYAVVVPDVLPSAPPVPVLGAELPAAPANAPDPALLSAGGLVQPAVSPASRIPEEVTATATVTITNSAGPMSSGLLLQGSVREQYRLRQSFAGLPPGALGQSRTPPRYEASLVAYQRPGVANRSTLQAQFPLRPLLLFGAEELDQATVNMDVLSPAAFSGGVLDTNGGLVASEGIGVLAGAGDLLSRQAVTIRPVTLTNFADFSSTGAIAVAAFELNLAGVAPGHHLVAQFPALPTNSFFVLARVLYREGLYGLQPIERLTSDSLGRASTAEPASGARLPGLTGAGQYVLEQIPGSQGVVSGIARNSAGQPSLGLPVQVRDQPWLAFSDNSGAFQLLAPLGQVQVQVSDLITGDTGTATVTVTDPQSATLANPSAIAQGPTVISVDPTNHATGVPRVSAVVLTFSKAINPGTLLNSGVQLVGSNGVPVPTSLTLNLKNTIATLLPTTQLDPSTRYNVVLSTNISDTAGLTLQGATSFDFSTESDALNRDAAKLTIYQPGATNIPASTLSNLPGFVAGTNSASIVAEGAPGTADPGQPVILINETTGETSTTLSKSDGSFFGVIHGGPDDFISATLQNQNGSRTVVRAAEQKFDDGSIGLYNGGGTVAVDGEGGAFQLNIPAGSVHTRTIFRLQPMTLAQVTNSLPTPPLDAQVIGGMKIAMQATDFSGDANVSLPMDPARIHFADGSPAEDGAYALAMVRQLEGGGIGYQIVDKLKYENGRLHSNTAPFEGFGDAFMDATAQNPAGVLGLFLSPANQLIEAAFTVLVLGTRPVTVTGRVGFCPAGHDGRCVDEAADQFLQGLVLADSHLADLQGGVQSLVSANRTPLPGAFISLVLPDVAAGRSGRLQSGLAYATSDRQGRYALVLPFANAGYVLQATHPRFQEHKAVPLIPFVDYQLGAGAVYRSFGFDVPIASDLPPRVDVAHAPLFPQTNETAKLTVDVIHSAATTVQLLVDSVSPSGPGAAKIQNQTETALGSNQKRVQADVTANAALTARIKISVTPSDPDTPSVTTYHNIAFGFLPPAVTNLAIQSDPDDKTPPQIERTAPLDGGVILAGAPLSLFFNEPIDSAVAQQASQFTLDDPNAGMPRLTLSPDQTRLDIFYGALKPDKQYDLTVAAQISDLAGNKLILPSTVNGGNFKLKFRTLPVSSTTLNSVGQGGGVAINGNYAYVLDRTGSGKLIVYDISNPSSPTVVSDTITFIGEPRDLVVLPQWAHVRTQGGAARTNDFLAVVGGNLGSSSVTGGDGSDGQDVNVFFQGQYLRVFDISDPAHPIRVLGTALTLRPDAVTKIRWDPPYLAFFETGSDFQQVGLINLQAMLIGFNATPDQIAHFPPNGFAGIDGVGTNNPDGDYVDPGEKVPLPQQSPTEFFGRDRSFLPDLNFGARPWLDFDFKARGNYCGVVFRDGAELDRLGHPTGNTLPAGYRTLSLGDTIDAPTATLPFKGGAVPKRLFTVLNLNVGTEQVADIRNLALVSLSPDSDGVSKLAVIDITIPASPVLTNLIVLPQELDLGLAQSVQRRPDGLLGLATSSDLVLLDPRQLLAPAQANTLHPAIVGIVPGAGSGNITLGANNAGVDAVALGGRSQLIEEAPQLQFVRSFQGLNLTDPSKLAGDPVTRQKFFDALTVESVVGPARFATNGNAASTLNPANSTNHYYVLMRAPGGAGAMIKLGLQSLNRSGYPLKNKGRDFAPVRAISEKGSELLKQKARDGCDAPIGELTAYRLAGDQDKSSPFYNLYLSKPFALVYERISAEQIQTLQQQVDRALLWSDFNLEAFIDPEMQDNPVLGPFAARVGSDAGSGLDLILVPRASVVAESFPGTYIPGPNPPPVSSPEKMPGTFGALSANNGEFRADTVDLVLPSRRMPIVFDRVLGGQDIYEGPFGRGWDFSYNQRLTVLRPELMERDHRLAVVVRALAKESTIAQPGDLLWHTGRGRLVLYTHTNQAPPEVAGDRLLDVLQWKSNIRTYYLPAPAEAGIFDPIFEFKDGQFARLTPDGRQYWYNRSGYLQKIYDKYPKNYHELRYNQRGELTKIIDGSIDNEARYLELGYYRLDGDSEFADGLDVRTNGIFVAGKIARLRDYTGRTVDFAYTSDGVLERRIGVEGSSANNGDGGRPETVYLYTDDCSGFLQGIVGGGQNPTAPLVSVSMDPQTGVPTGGAGAAGGSVSILAPSQNSAASAAGSSSSITEPDGAHVNYTFDSHGFPTEADFSGPRNGNAITKTTYGPYGLLTHVEYPLGNSVDYTYDTNNTLLRARANLLSEVHHPGPRGGPTLTRSIPDYDPLYNLPVSGQTDFNGKSVNIALTSDNRDVHTITYENAGTRTLDYNEFGQLEKETTPDGVVIDPTYDDATGFESSEARGPATYGFEYDGSKAGQLGVPTRVTPPVGAPITASYDDRLLLLQVTRGGLVEKRGYDRNGNPKYIERTVGSGSGGKLVQERVYNDVGFLEKITLKNIEVEGQPTDLVTEFHSTARDSWRVREIVFPGGQSKQFTYDHLGHIVGMTLGTYSEGYGRDLDGNLTSLTQGGTLTHEYFYDGYDRMTNEVSHLANGDEQEQVGYFGGGQVSSLTIQDPSFGMVYQSQVNEIDGLGRPRNTTTTGSSVSATRQIDYPSVSSGGSIVVTGPRDTFTTLFDSGGRVTERKDSLADLTLSPDGNGNILGTSSKEGTGFAFTYNTSAGYDELDHATSGSDDSGTRYTFTPRFDGAVTSVSDGEGHQVLQQFTALGEPISKTRESGVQFTYHHNKNRQMTLLGDGTSQGETAAFDTGTLRIQQRTLRSGAAFGYGNPNSLNLPQSATLTPGGGIMTLSYDNLGRLTGQNLNYPATAPYQTSFTPDALGRVRSMKYGPNGNNSAVFGYDLLGPLTSATYNEELGTFPVAITIRDDGSRATLTYPSQVQLTEARDPGARLLGIQGPGGAQLLKVNRYDGATQLGEALLGDGLIKASTSYDGRRRVSARRYERVADGALLADVRYQYDRADNCTIRQEINRNGRAEAYTYDHDNRLTRVDVGLRPVVPGAVRLSSAGLQTQAGFEAGWFSRVFGFDAGGLDLLVSAVTSNPDAPLLPDLPPFMGALDGHDSMLFAESLDGKPRPPPDTLGNTVGTVLQIREAGKSEPTPVLAQLSYNGLSHLVQVRYTNSGDTITIDYGTQPNGLVSYRKFSRNGVVEQESALVYDAGRLLEEYEHSGPTNLLRARFYYADEDSPFAADLADGSGNLQRYYYLRDAQDSVVAVADSGGNVVERISYDAWGQPVIQARDQAPPRLSAVIQSTNNELLVQFSEPVLPPLSSTGPGTALITSSAGLQGKFQLTGNSGPISLGSVAYVEDLPGFPFGTVVRLQPQGNLNGMLTLAVSAGAIVDEWGLPNAAEQASFSLGSSGTVLFQGVPAGSTAPPRVARSAIGSPFLFQGQFFDYDAGLLYLRARFYDPFTGQFLQQDPVPYGDSVNPYAGFGNNPITFRDPAGTALLDKHLANAQARQRARRAARSPDSTEEEQERSGVQPVARSRGPRGGMDPDAATEIDQPAIHDLSTREDSLTDAEADAVTTLLPPGGGGPPPPPPPLTDRVWRGMKVPLNGGLGAVVEQLEAGRLQSPYEFNTRDNPAARRSREDIRKEQLRRVREILARGKGMEGFSAEQTAAMGENELLALLHISGSGGEATMISTALNPFAYDGPIRWAGFGPAGTRPRQDQISVLIEFEVDRGAGVRGLNPDEGVEVTFLDELRFRSATMYIVVGDDRGGYRLEQFGFYPGRP